MHTRINTHTHTHIYQEIDSRGWYRNRSCHKETIYQFVIYALLNTFFHSCFLDCCLGTEGNITQRQIIQRLIHRYDSKTASPRTQIKDSVFLIHVSRISSILLKPLLFLYRSFTVYFLV